MPHYLNEYTHSIEHPEAFRTKQARRVAWSTFPNTILSNDSNGVPRWFGDGELNTSALCLDDQVMQGRGEQVAIYYDSPVTNTKRRITYNVLLYQVSRFAGVLKSRGVAPGDRVLIYMPMIPEAVVAMLAVARLGAIHSVVFGGFAAHELAVRVDHAWPKIIVSASCGIEGDRVIPYKPLLDEALQEASHEVDHCVIVRRPECEAEFVAERDEDWAALMAEAELVGPTPVRATDLLYILYT